MILAWSEHRYNSDVPGRGILPGVRQNLINHSIARDDQLPVSWNFGQNGPKVGIPAQPLARVSKIFPTPAARSSGTWLRQPQSRGL